MKPRRNGATVSRTISVRPTVWIITPLLGVLAYAASMAGVSAETSKDVADMNLHELMNVRISPFEVATDLDRGYRASNSVSGSRFDTPIRDLPFAIQAFTESFITDNKPVNIYDIARYSPGVTYRSNDFNEGNANLAIRGFAVSATPGNIQILRDGFQGPSIFDFSNLARVEVVKGPASFLYGQVAPGGIVNMITKSPQSRFATSADATYGSYGQYRLEADVTGPVSNTLFFRVIGAYDQDLHYWDPYDAHAYNFAPSLLWQPSARISVALKYENYRKVETPQLMQKPTYGRQSGVVPTASDPNLQGVEVPGLPDNWNSMAYADFRRSDADGISAWFDVEVDEHWNLRAGYSHQYYNIDALFSGNFGMSNNETFLQGRRFRRQIYTNHGDTYSLDAVGRYSFDGASLRLLIGAQQVKRRFDRWAAQAPNDPALGSNPIASPLPLWDLRDPATWNREVTIPLATLTASPADLSSAYTDRSIYAGATVGVLDDRLLLLAGWRVTSTNSLLTDHFLSPPTGATRITARKNTPQFGVLYKFAPGLSAFASYAESFVPGAQILLLPDGSSAPAEPTQGKGYDLGMKADLLDGRVSGTVTLFDLRNNRIVNDLALTNTAGSVTIYTVQSGEQRSRGVELDATIAASEQWQLYLSYSYLHARIVELSGNDAAILSQNPATLDAAGQQNYKNVSLLHNARLQMSAPHMANVWTRYDFTQAALKGAYLGGGINFVYDQTILPDSPASSRQTYTLLNAMIGYSWAWNSARAKLELMGKNLADEHYRPSQSTRARPREWLLSFAVNR